MQRQIIGAKPALPVLPGSYLVMLCLLVPQVSFGQQPGLTANPDPNAQIIMQELPPGAQAEPPPQPWTPEQSMSHSALLLRQLLQVLLALAFVLGLLWLLKGLWLHKWANVLRTGKQGRLIIHDSLRLDDKHTLYFIGLDTDTEVLLGVSAQQGIATIWKKRTVRPKGAFAQQLADNQGSDDVPI